MNVFTTPCITLKSCLAHGNVILEMGVTYMDMICPRILGTKCSHSSGHDGNFSYISILMFGIVIHQKGIFEFLIKL